MKKAFKKLGIIGVIVLTCYLGLYIKLKTEASKPDYTTGLLETYYDMETGEYYYYQLNTDVDKENYRKIYNAIMNLDKSVKLKDTKTFNKMSKIYLFVLNDHPEIFWCSNNPEFRVYISGNGKITFDYIMTKEEIKKAQYEIDMFEKDLKEASIKEDMTDYEKEIAIYDYISRNTKFDKFSVYEDKDYSQGIYSVVNGKTVCRGYSLMFKYICNKNNIPCIVVVGTLEPNVKSVNSNTDHSWNEVMIDGEWYMVDLTGSRKSVYDGNYFDTTFYKFNITTEDLLKSSSINNGAKVPECTSVKYDYYRQTDTYFEKADAFKIQDLVNEKDKKEKHEHYLDLKCKDKELFEEMLLLIDIEDIGAWRDELSGTVRVRTKRSDSDLYIIHVEW